MRHEESRDSSLCSNGEGLTIVTAITALLSVVLSPYFYRFFPILFGTGLAPITFALTPLPGPVVLYLGQRFAGQPEAETISALVVAAVSAVSLFAVLNSNLYLVSGLFLSGPPVSYVGGIAGALLNRDSGQPSPKLFQSWWGWPDLNRRFRGLLARIRLPSHAASPGFWKVSLLDLASRQPLEARAGPVSL
jgi:hypothetical protein